MNKYIERIDRRYAKVCIYAGVTVLLTVAACMVLYTASPVFAKVWELVCTVLEPIVYGAALSYVLNPLVKRVSHALRRRGCFVKNPVRRRRISVAISLVLVLLVILALTAVFVLMVTHSIASLRIEQIQSLLGTAQGDLVDLLKVAHERLVEWRVLSNDEGANPLAMFSNVKEILTNVVFAIIFGIYFLIDGPYVFIYLGRVGHVFFKDDIAVDHQRLMADADKVFSGYFRGQGIDAAVVGVLSGIILTAIGVPFGPLVGLLAGLGNLIPYVGGPVGFGSIALVCLPSAAWGKMIAGFVAMGLIMVVDANVINPKLLSDNVEVHPILVLAALIGGGAVGGIAGMLVAVPFAAFLKIQLDRWVEKREAEEVAAHRREVAARAQGSAPRKATK
jgi:predicted PurR-regulated permease PerM